MKTIAIIPARGGSKRIPRKNIRLFSDLPIIAWSIKTAISSKCFDKIIVSTDDQEISEIALSYGAEIPFIRPKSLSDDHTKTSDVISHALQFEESEGNHYEYACCIYPTAPFLKEDSLKIGLKMIKKGIYDFVFSATTYAFPVQRGFSFNPQDGLKMLFPQYKEARSQDLKEIFHDAGQFYWGQSRAWLDDLPIFSNHSLPIILPREEVTDIDTEEDFKEAELKFKLLQSPDLRG